MLAAVAAACLGAVCAPQNALAADSGKDDVQTVYCLTPSRRAALVQAAAALGVARTVPGDPSLVRVTASGPTMTAPTWAGHDPDAFRRTCTALMAADAAARPSGGGAGGGDSGGLLTSLAVAAGGALFALAGQLFERSTGGRRERARAVVTAATGFAVSAGEYLDAWQRNTDTAHEPTAAARAALAAALRGLAVTGERSRQAEALARSLPLAQPPVAVGATATGPRALPAHERPALAEEQHSLLEAHVDAALRLTRSAGVWHLRRLVRGPDQVPGSQDQDAGDHA